MKSADFAQPPILPFRGWQRILVVAGPGIVVMLADTDAGSIITAAQSGAEWGYQLLLLQFILVPILYIVQELTERLGIVTRKGHTELIRDHFGTSWAWLSVATLVLACIGALLSELSGLASVGLIMGVPTPITMSQIVVVLIFMAYRGLYLAVGADVSQRQGPFPVPLELARGPRPALSQYRQSACRAGLGLAGAWDASGP